MRSCRQSAGGPGQRAAVADLVVELGEARSGTLRGELSRALGDPSLEIGYWLRDRAVFVDAEGRPLTPPKLGSGRSMTVLEREGQPVAALVHDSAVLEDPGLLEAVASAAQLAAANARLRADVQARSRSLQRRVGGSWRHAMRDAAGWSVAYTTGPRLGSERWR